MIKGVVQIYA